MALARPDSFSSSQPLSPATMRNRRPDGIVDVVLDNTKPFLDAAEAISDLVPFPGLNLITKGLNNLVERVQLIRANSVERQAFLEEIKVLQDTLKHTTAKTRIMIEGYEADDKDKKNLADSISGSPGLQMRSLELRCDLNARSKDLKGSGGVIGVIIAFVYAPRNKSILSEMKDTLERARNQFMFKGQISIEKILEGVERQVKDTHRILREAEEKKIVDSIPHAAAGYRSVDDLKSQYMEGTREDLFDELDLWTADDLLDTGPIPFFLLSGGAGLGKSTIAHQLCSRLDAEGLLGGSFFYVRGGGDLESARSIFPTLARQLALTQPQLYPHIIRSAKEYLKRGKQQQMHHSFKDLLLEPLREPSLSQHTPVFLVIDALDECNDRDLIPDLLRNLLQLVREIPWLRVFATSRPEPHVIPVLTANDAVNIVYHRSLNDTLQEWNGDVRFYLETTLSKIQPYDNFVCGHPYRLEALVRRAGGVFIYARLAVRFLDIYHDNPKEQFQLLLSSDGVALSPLDALYLQILRSAFPADSLPLSSPRRQRLRLFLTVLALQQSPLNPEVISLLLSNADPSMDSDTVAQMADKLRSIIVVQDGGELMPLHATFAEFLTDAERCIDPLYHINPLEGHALLASACLAAFTFKNATEWLNNEINVYMPFKEFGRYIVYKWVSHLIKAECSEKLV
ncbi:hypothetical protein K474DRAFT_1191428 [Panus rudis PR-1116 ss-1]|nr:hypothetical protein K474DRAFT_1191428 [Panus rudis PR-1116 ss-1]